MQGRITIATITTKDENMVKLAKKINEKNTHETIYRRGLQVIADEELGELKNKC